MFWKKKGAVVNMGLLDFVCIMAKVLAVITVVEVFIIMSFVVVLCVKAVIEGARDALKKNKEKLD